MSLPIRAAAAVRQGVLKQGVAFEFVLRYLALQVVVPMKRYMLLIPIIPMLAVPIAQILRLAVVLPITMEMALPVPAILVLVSPAPLQIGPVNILLLPVLAQRARQNMLLPIIVEVPRPVKPESSTILVAVGVHVILLIIPAAPEAPVKPVPRELRFVVPLVASMAVAAERVRTIVLPQQPQHLGVPVLVVAQPPRNLVLAPQRSLDAEILERLLMTRPAVRVQFPLAIM